MREQQGGDGFKVGREEKGKASTMAPVLMAHECVTVIAVVSGYGRMSRVFRKHQGQPFWVRIPALPFLSTITEQIH